MRRSARPGTPVLGLRTWSRLPTDIAGPRPVPSPPSGRPGEPHLPPARPDMWTTRRPWSAPLARPGPVPAQAHPLRSGLQPLRRSSGAWRAWCALLLRPRPRRTWRRPSRLGPPRPLCGVRRRPRRTPASSLQLRRRSEPQTWRTVAPGRPGSPPLTTLRSRPGTPRARCPGLPAHRAHACADVVDPGASASAPGPVCP